MNRLTRIVKGALELLFPQNCLSCGDSLVSSRTKLCPSCMSRFQRENTVLCPSCGRTAIACQCGVFYLKREMLPWNMQDFGPVAARFYTTDASFEDLRMTRNLILQCKDVRCPGAAELFAMEIGFRLKELFLQMDEELSRWIVTYPPRNPQNLLEKGFDHGEVLAKALARALELECRRTMIRCSSRTQKELGAEDRLVNASESLGVIRNAIPSGGRFILVDDVITTGATMAAAAELLVRNGASAVLPVAAAKTLSRSKDGRF